MTKTKTSFRAPSGGHRVRTLLLASLSLCAVTVAASSRRVFRPGTVWPDNRGVHINAHGGGVLAYKGTYYWFGEHKSAKTSLAHVGVNCYASKNLADWTYRGVALAVTAERGHDLERGCTLERPKVIYCPSTGKFVMWFHLELKGRGYEEARYGVAVADRPEGPYRFLRSGRVNPGRYPLEFTPADIAVLDTLDARNYARWWTAGWMDAVRKGLFVKRDILHPSRMGAAGQMARDQTVFVDTDGRAYHIYSSEENLTLQIAELTGDYTAHTGRYIRVAPGGQNEAPTLFRHGDTYWMITSGCTGWAPNRARMFSAPSVWGPWTEHPSPCRGPRADITFGAQGTYVLPVGRQLVFMADIWKPENLEDSRYVWLPVRFDEGVPVIEWTGEWQL